MTLSRVWVNCLRIVQQAELEPGPQLNLIYGDNGMGKTSVLEAIDVLSRGRSFRTRHIHALLTRGQPELSINAMLLRNGQQLSIGIRKTRAATIARLQEEQVASLSELACVLPVQALHPGSHDLVQGPNSDRRAYLDWGVFHHYPQFYSRWRRYQRTLKQRNAALKRSYNYRLIEALDTQLSTEARHIDKLRTTYLADLQPLLEEYSATLLGTSRLSVEYQRGWDAEAGLESELRRALKADSQRGHTSVGAHRAHLIVRLDGDRATQVASRGQQKLLATALRLAQIRLYARAEPTLAVLLVDDPVAELDRHHRRAVLNSIAALNVQVFLTALRPQDIDVSLWGNACLFHVKRGHVLAVV